MPVIGMMLRNASVTSFSCLLVVKLPCLYNVPFETNRPPDRFGDWSAEQRQFFSMHCRSVLERLWWFALRRCFACTLMCCCTCPESSCVSALRNRNYCALVSHQDQPVAMLQVRPLRYWQVWSSTFSRVLCNDFVNWNSSLLTSPVTTGKGALMGSARPYWAPSTQIEIRNTINLWSEGASSQ